MMDDRSAPLRRMLRIPEHVEPVAVTPLGYHSEPPKERPVQSTADLSGFRRGDKRRLAALLNGKLSLDDVVHYDAYGKSEGEP